MDIALGVSLTSFTRAIDEVILSRLLHTWNLVNGACWLGRGAWNVAAESPICVTQILAVGEVGPYQRRSSKEMF